MDAGKDQANVSMGVKTDEHHTCRITSSILSVSILDWGHITPLSKGHNAILECILIVAVKICVDASTIYPDHAL